MNDVDQFFASMDGAEIPGGCDYCDAVQRIAPAEQGWTLTVLHDMWCPWWIERQWRSR